MLFDLKLFDLMLLYDMICYLFCLYRSRSYLQADGEGGEADGVELMSEKVLSPEDFKQLRKLRLQKSIEWHRRVGSIIHLMIFDDI